MLDGLTTPDDFLAARVAEGAAERTIGLADGKSVRLALTVRLETPGEACVAISSTVAFLHEPPLPDDIAVRLDDRLYDGLYDGLAAVDGPLPPERLRLAITALTSEPPLATILTPIATPVATPVDWRLVAALGDTLAALAAEAVARAWPALVAPRR